MKVFNILPHQTKCFSDRRSYLLFITSDIYQGEEVRILSTHLCKCLQLVVAPKIEQLK